MSLDHAERDELDVQRGPPRLARARAVDAVPPHQDESVGEYVESNHEAAGGGSVLEFAAFEFVFVLDEGGDGFRHGSYFRVAVT